MNKPISPAMHGLIDYGFGAISTLGPTLLDLPPAARPLPQAAGVFGTVLDALTDQRYAVMRLIPFRGHQAVETVEIPTLLVATIAAGAWKTPRSRMFLGALFAALVAVYALTDWDATPE